MRDDCIFKTEHYPNGCKARDDREPDCATCAFYKNQQMQKESLKRAEELFNRRSWQKAEKVMHMQTWTTEEEEYIKAHKDDRPGEIAAALGRSEWAVVAKRKRMRAEGLV